MAQLGANPAIAVSLELVADRPRTAPRCCILGLSHHTLHGRVSEPIATRPARVQAAHERSLDLLHDRSQSTSRSRRRSSAGGRSKRNSAPGVGYDAGVESPASRGVQSLLQSYPATGLTR